MITPSIAAQIAGTADFRIAEPSDHPITVEERAMAILTGYEIAARYGIDLAAHVAAAACAAPIRRAP